MNGVEAAGLWTALNLIYLIYVSVRVGQARTKLKINLGDGGHPEMIRAIRTQGNYVEYAPAALIGLLLLALVGAPVVVVHVLGGAFLLVRIAYLAGLGMNVWPAGRFVGTLGTMLTLLATAGALLWYAVIAR